MSRFLGQGGSSLFMFAITKQFDQRNDDECQLAQVTKGQLKRHKRHPSLRAGLRAFSLLFKQKNICTISNCSIQIACHFIQICY
mgnify:CR=1 FL=1